MENKETLENVLPQSLNFSYDLQTIYDVRLRYEVIGIHPQGGEIAENQTKWKIPGSILPLKGREVYFCHFD